MKNALVMAYIGDVVYELHVREYLTNKGIAKVNELQKASLDFVSAKSQRRHIEYLINNNFLTEKEIEIYKWGRNAHGGRSKSTDIVTYRIATGFEALIGVLNEEKNTTRIEEIMKEVFKNQ